MPWLRWATATILAWFRLRHHYRRVEGLGEFTGPLPQFKNGSVYGARWWAGADRIANFSVGGPDMIGLASSAGQFR